MKRTVLTFGLISGVIVSFFMLLSLYLFTCGEDFSGSMIIGYASMLAAFSFIYVGIKSYRDKHNDGVITFGKALKIGLLIALISSTCYVLVWLVEYYFFMPDFMDKYAAQVMKGLHDKGATAAEIAAKTKELDFARIAYKSPMGIILITYSEVLPLGILVALICALILNRKAVPGKQTPA